MGWVRGWRGVRGLLKRGSGMGWSCEWGNARCGRETGNGKGKGKGKEKEKEEGRDYGQSKVLARAVAKGVSSILTTWTLCDQTRILYIL